MNDLYWHCLKCGAHDPVEPTDESALGDSEKCITCGDGMAHVVTTRTGAKYEQGRALGLDIDTAWSRATAPDLDAWALASARRADAMAAEVEALRRERDNLLASAPGDEAQAFRDGYVSGRLGDVWAAGRLLVEQFRERQDRMVAEADRLRRERDEAVLCGVTVADVCLWLEEMEDPMARNALQLIDKNVSDGELLLVERLRVKNAEVERDEAEQRTAERIAAWLDRAYGPHGMVGRIAVRIRDGVWRDDEDK